MSLLEQHDAIRRSESVADQILDKLKDLKWASPSEYRRKFACTLSLTYIYPDCTVESALKTVHALIEIPDEVLHRVVKMFYNGLDEFACANKVDLLDEHENVVLKVRLERFSNDQLNEIVVEQPE